MAKTALNTTTQSLDTWLTKSILTVLHLTVVTVPLFFLFTTNELFEFNKLMLVYLYTIIGASLFGFRLVLHGTKLLKPTYLDIPIFIFIISQLLSTLFSMHPYTSLVGYYSRFHGGLLSTISYTMIYYIAVHTLTRESLRQLFLSSALSAGIVAVYGILERFGMSFSCLMVSGSLDVECWVQDVQSRVFASFGQPNWLAAYVILLMPVYLSLAAISKTTWRRWLYAVVSVLLVVALFFTSSRSGILGWYGGLGVAGVLGGFVWWKMRKNAGDAGKIWGGIHLKLLLGVLAAWTMLAVMIEAPYTPSLPTNTTSPQESVAPVSPENEPAVNRLDLGGTDSGEIRKIVWTGAIDVWRRYPWLGSGVETFGYSYYLDRPLEHNHVSEWDFLYNKAHNEFLNFLATTGLIGLLSYLLLLGAFGWTLLSYLYQQTKTPFSEQKLSDATLMIGLASGTTALMISNFFGFSTVMVSVLLFLFFATVHIFKSPEKIQLKYREITHLQWSGFTIVLVVGLLLVNAAMRHWSADIEYVQAKSLLDSGNLELGLEKLDSAISKNPSEATYIDTFADRYAQYAVAFAQAGDATQSAALAETALQASTLVMQLNPEQLNFHRTRARLLITLGQIDPMYLEEAVSVLQDARKRAPTDAKLLFNIGALEMELDDTDAAIAALTEAIELKPNYQSARWQLALAHERAGNSEAALEQLKYIQQHLAPDDQPVQDKIATLSASVSDQQ